jgi:hypothetical protein
MVESIKADWLATDGSIWVSLIYLYAFCQFPHRPIFKAKIKIFNDDIKFKKKKMKCTEGSSIPIRLKNILDQ